MERIIRGVIQIGGLPENDLALSNWHKLLEYSLEFPIEEDRKINEYLKLFYAQLSSPPDFALVKEYFEKQDEIEVVSRLEEVKKAVLYTHTNFLSIIRAERHQQTIKSLILVCRDAQQIAEHGRNLDKPGPSGKKLLKGPQDAINFMSDKLAELTEIEVGKKLEGITTEDADDILIEYDEAKKTNNWNRNLFGFEPIDSVCQGHKLGEFWVHCAYPGELKTSLALNYAYYNSMSLGRNIFYAILEMPYEQLRRQLFCLHSSHGKFVSEWHMLDKKSGRKDPYLGLDYRSVRDGMLDDLGRQRLAIVAQDFKAHCKGKLYVWKPAEEATIGDIERKADLFHNKFSCDGIVIDYLGKVKPSKRVFSETDRINGVVSSARDIALNFARGRGVPVLALFQMNRQGKLRADKNDGRYDVAAISYANRIMEDADCVSYTYLNDELRKQGKFYMGCLKNRDNPQFDLMVGKIL